jgi:hypothetical protein
MAVRVYSISPSRIDGTANGEPLMLTLDLNVLESPRHQESNPKALSFPLEVGKQWPVSHNPYLGTSTVELVEFQVRP